MAKLKNMMNFIKQKILECCEKGDNLAIFCIHNTVRDMVKQQIKLADYEIHDFTNLRNPDSASSKFKVGCGTQIALLKNKGSYCKVDLSTCKYAIFTELSYSPFDHVKSEKMLKSCTNEVKEVYYLIGENSKVDKWMLSRLQKKQWTHSLYFSNDRKASELVRAANTFSFQNMETPESVRKFIDENS